MSIKKNHILLPIVIIIWALLFYQIYTYIKPSNTVNIKQESKLFVPPPIKTKDTFSLKKIDRDPFLGTLYQKRVVQKTKASKVKVKLQEPWPTIKFLGVVEGTNSKDQAFIISINGQQQILQPGEVDENLFFKSGSQKKIVFTFNNETKEFELM